MLVVHQFDAPFARLLKILLCYLRSGSEDQVSHGPHFVYPLRPIFEDMPAFLPFCRVAKKNFLGIVHDRVDGSKRTTGRDGRTDAIACKVGTPIRKTLAHMHELHAKTLQSVAGEEKEISVDYNDAVNTALDFIEKEFYAKNDRGGCCTHPNDVEITEANNGLNASQKEDVGRNPKTEAAPEELVVDRDEYDDLFDDAFIKAVEDAENRLLSASKQLDGPISSRTERLEVLGISRKDTSVVLHGKYCENRTALDVELQDQWSDSDIKVGDIVRVVRCEDIHFVPAPKQQEKRIVVNARNNLLIVHPDALLNGTSIASSFSCVRKSVISDQARASASSDTVASLYGKLTHILLQETLVKFARGELSLTKLASSIPGMISLSHQTAH